MVCLLTHMWIRTQLKTQRPSLQLSGALFPSFLSKFQPCWCSPIPVPVSISQGDCQVGFGFLLLVLHSRNWTQAVHCERRAHPFPFCQGPQTSAAWGSRSGSIKSYVLLFLSCMRWEGQFNLLSHHDEAGAQFFLLLNFIEMDPDRRHSFVSGFLCSTFCEDQPCCFK